MRSPNTNQSRLMGRAMLAWLAISVPLVLTGCKKTYEAPVAPGSTTPDATNLPAAGIDTDGDRLDDRDELLGWEIAVDEQGYGEPIVRRVTSNPELADTDGDGMTDKSEFIRRTDPTRWDTDGDGLTDPEELNRWKTNPISVDTDGDARGPDGNLAPSRELFDGLELKNNGTSPTLADTDGDGRSDFEELNNSSRSPLIAELPQAQIEFAGKLDMFLNIEYEESLGQEEQYGTSISTENSTTSSVSYENSITTEVGVALTLKAKADAFPPGFGGESEVEGHVNVTYGHTWSESQETSKTMGEEYSRYVADSKSKTEAFSSGTVTLGVEVENVGPSTFGVDDLALTLLLFAPGESGASRDFRTLATLQSATTNLVLSPGERSEVIQFATDDVNPDLMKQFLASPSSMVLRPTSFGLTNAGGVDFDFVTETTATQTALVEIKFGPEDFQVYRVATNVQRMPDGALAGVTMAEVMQTLGFAKGSGYMTEEQFATDSGGNTVSNGFVLTSLGGRTYQEDSGFPVAFWIVDRKSEDGSRIGGALPDFEDITLLPGEEIQLIYALDLDKDGLSDSLETFFATGPDSGDTDSDGLDDYEEVVTGVMAGTDTSGNAIAGLVPFGYPKLVYTNPRSADSDSDGLTDAEEKALGSDPIHPDTDRDGQVDGVDTCPTTAARTLLVDPENGTKNGPGFTWDTAYSHLQEALTAAYAANEQNADCSDDVAEIWVARGIYKPDGGIGSTPGSLDDTESFLLNTSVAIYGGFRGIETKREQRDANPLTNGTELSGDLKGDDLLGGDRSDNSNRICFATLANLTFTLDGFTIASGDSPDRGAGLDLNDGRGTWRNLLFIDNRVAKDGGAVFIYTGTHQFENCSFSKNSAFDGGAVSIEFDEASTTFVDCQFLDNSATDDGGALRVGNTAFGDTLIERCVFLRNRADNDSGGAISIKDAKVMIRETVFDSNSAKDQGGAVSNESSGSSSFVGGVNLVNCRVAGNSLFDANCQGSGLYNEYEDGALMNVVNCTVDGNLANTSGVQPAFLGEAFHGAVFGATSVTNCLIFNNLRYAYWLGPDIGNPAVLLSGNGYFPDQAAQINAIPSASVRYCLIQSLGVPTSAWSTGSAASFWFPSPGTTGLGDYSYTEPTVLTQSSTPIGPSGAMTEESLGIDTGDNFVDIDLNSIGSQFLPAADLTGQTRFVDGDGDGTTFVDMGAFEYVGG